MSCTAQEKELFECLRQFPYSRIKPEATRLLSKILANVVDNEHDEKFTRIRIGSDKFSSLIASQPECMHVLGLVGFKRSGEHLMLIRPFNISLVRFAHRYLDAFWQYQQWLTAPSPVTEVMSVCATADVELDKLAWWQRCRNGSGRVTDGNLRSLLHSLRLVQINLQHIHVPRVATMLPGHGTTPTVTPAVLALYHTACTNLLRCLLQVLDIYSPLASGAVTSVASTELARKVVDKAACVITVHLPQLLPTPAHALALLTDLSERPSADPLFTIITQALNTHPTVFDLSNPAESLFERIAVEIDKPRLKNALLDGETAVRLHESEQDDGAAHRHKGHRPEVRTVLEALKVDTTSLGSGMSPSGVNSGSFTGSAANTPSRAAGSSGQSLSSSTTVPNLSQSGGGALPSTRSALSMLRFSSAADDSTLHGTGKADKESTTRKSFFGLGLSKASSTPRRAPESRSSMAPMARD